MIELADFDVKIVNARIVNGVNKEHVGSLGVKGGRILETGEVSGDAIHVINADGLYALPGFIDPHSHGDTGFAWYPNCESAVMQGCTTVVAGQCGGSPAPLNQYIRAPGVIWDEVYEKNPFIYHGKSLYHIDEVNEILTKKYGWAIEYRTMAGYFYKINSQGISINYVPLLGHGTVRFHVLGEDYKREATTSEVSEMKELIHKGRMAHPTPCTQS